MALLTATTVCAQAPAWQTAVATSGVYSVIEDAAADGQGNVYVVGVFRGTATFGATALVSAGETDAFIAKWNSASNAFVWAQRAGGTGADYASAVAVQAGRVYAAGSFANAATFGGLSLTSAGERDIFVTSLTDVGNAGTFTWAQRAGGVEREDATGIAVQGADIYVVGSFQSAAAPFGGTVLVNGGYTFHSDAFVAKLTEGNGNAAFTWAKRAGGANYDDQAVDVAVQGPAVYLVGTFAGNAAEFDQLRLSCLGPSDVFIAKLTDAGASSSFTWVQRAGSTNANMGDLGHAVAVNGPNVYVAGAFSGPTGSFGSFTLTNAGQFTDVFVAKLVDLGASSSFVWAQGAGGVSGDQPTGLAVVGNNVYVAGNFGSETIAFGNIVLANTLSGFDSPADVFLAKIEDLGAGARFTWAQQAGGVGYDVASCLAIAGSSVYVGGTFDSPIARFGALALASGGNTPAYLASLLDPATLAVHIAGDTLVCPGGTLTLTAVASAPATAYQWSTGATTATIQVTQPGTYTVTTTFNNGATRTAQHRVIAFAPVVQILGDSVLCPGQTLNLLGIAPQASSYAWNTGTTAAALAVTQPGTYTLTVSFGSGCTAVRRIVVRAPALAIAGPIVLCAGGSGVLMAQAPGAVAFRWNTGTTTAALSVSQAGSYAVVATFPNGCTLTATHVITSAGAAIRGDSLVCVGRSIQLTAAQAGATAYQWSTGATTATIDVTQSGMFSVLVFYGPGCQSSASQRIRQLPASAPLNLGADTTICEGTGLRLQLSPPASGVLAGYRWSTGETTPTIMVNQPGTYTLEVRNACETRNVSRHVAVRPCVMIPNVITPNNDGLNDRLVILGLPTGPWSLRVFNRWGREVFASTDYQHNWGESAAPGTYYYLLSQPVSGKVYKGWVEVVN